MHACYAAYCMRCACGARTTVFLRRRHHPDDEVVCCGRHARSGEQEVAPIERTQPAFTFAKARRRTATVAVPRGQYLPASVVK